MTTPRLKHPTRKEPSHGRRISAIADVLHDASETHHIVFKIVDGEDADWASWTRTGYSALGLPELLGRAPCAASLSIYWFLRQAVRRGLDDGRWEDYYAGALIDALAVAPARRTCLRCLLGRHRHCPGVTGKPCGVRLRVPRTWTSSALSVVNDTCVPCATM